MYKIPTNFFFTCICTCMSFTHAHAHVDVRTAGAAELGKEVRAISVILN